MTGWDALVRAALLGTERQEVELSGLPAAVRELVPAGADPARVLLDAAALVRGYRAAGAVPVHHVPAESPAPRDDRPVAPVLAARRLDRLLSGEHAGLLPEWLDLVARKGFRPPPERLPELAEAARARTALRPAVALAAGSRGPWLAERQPRWAFLAGAPTADAAAPPDPSDDDWRFGDAAGRRDWLARAHAADPDLARAELTAALPTEPAAARAGLLDALRGSLGPGDEDVLDAALDDRSQDVRRVAAELLAALPGSRRAARMAARLADLVTVDRARARLVVALPVECDAAMVRDGVVPTAPRGTGERAWWLGQVVAATPLAWWRAVDPDPARVLALRIDGPAAELTGGLARAAVAQRDTGWATALLVARTDHLVAEDVAGLVGVLPRDRWAAAVGERVARDRLSGLTGLFLSLPAPWPADLATLVLDQLDAQAAQRTLAPIADTAARVVPAAAFGHPLLDRPAPPDACPWHRRLAEALLFRRAMTEELS